MKKHIILFFVLLGAFTMESQAQDYSRAIGLRGGLGANVIRQLL